jgi:hypothetical protein
MPGPRAQGEDNSRSTEALPGMDREAAGTIAALFVDLEPEDVVSESVNEEDETAPQMISEGPFPL